MRYRISGTEERAWKILKAKNGVQFRNKVWMLMQTETVRGAAKKLKVGCPATLYVWLRKY